MNIILYMRVRGHANAWSQMKPSGMKPSRMDAAGFEPEETREGPKQVQQEKTWQLRPVWLPKQIQLQLASCLSW